MPAKLTPTAALIDHILREQGTSLAQVVADGRTRNLSWDAIADEVRQHVRRHPLGASLSVSFETLRQWALSGRLGNPTQPSTAA